MKNITNKEKSQLNRKNYKVWKETSLNTNGFFVIFEGFLSSGRLRNISGNALKLYIYFGIYSNNYTGEVWHSIKTISEYFGKSERTISYWIAELEKMNLIRRYQLKPNENAHTFLQPYPSGKNR